MLTRALLEKRLLSPTPVCQETAPQTRRVVCLSRALLQRRENYPISDHLLVSHRPLTVEKAVVGQEKARPVAGALAASKPMPRPTGLTHLQQRAVEHRTEKSYLTI